MNESKRIEQTHRTLMVRHGMAPALVAIIAERDRQDQKRGTVEERGDMTIDGA